MSVSELLATKLIENEFAAYENIETLMASPHAISKRGYTIASYALCGFANLSSLGVQIGVLPGLAPLFGSPPARLLLVSSLHCKLLALRAYRLNPLPPIVYT
jgi:CNT family concentrative nucleoside transporter